VDRTRGLVVQRQTSLVAQPSRRHTAIARNPPHVPLRGVIDSGTTIVPLDQYGIYIGRRIVPTLGGAPKIISLFSMNMA
jgi:hypothetical protein